MFSGGFSWRYNVMFPARSFERAPDNICYEYILQEIDIYAQEVTTRLTPRSVDKSLQDPSQISASSVRII